MYIKKQTQIKMNRVGLSISNRMGTEFHKGKGLAGSVYAVRWTGQPGPEVVFIMEHVPVCGLKRHCFPQ
jgi:hypothetical protein